MRTLKKRIIFLIVILLTIFGDQITKNMVRINVIYGDYIPLVGKTLVLTRIENTGAFLGFASSFSPFVRNSLLLGVPFIVLTALILYFFLSKKTDIPTTIFFALITAGGLSNLYDRFVYGSVTDFLFIDLGFLKTGIFNIADSGITIGVLFLFFYNIIYKMPRSNHDDELTEA